MFTPVALPAPSTVSAYHGTVAYSRFDGKAFSLVVGGKVARVATRSVPFDVDLGPDASGRTVAVYSRCASDPNANFGAGAMSYPDGYAQGCRVFLYDPAVDRERPVANASGFMPAIWRDTVVYAVGSATGALYARVGGRTVRLNDGGRSFCRVNGRCEAGTSVSYSGVDIEGTRVAVAREVGGIGEAGGTQMVLTGIGRRPKVVEARENGISYLAMRFPSLRSGSLYYAETCAGDPGGCSQTFRRYSSSGVESVASSPSSYLTGFAQDGANAYFVRAPEDHWDKDFRRVCPCRLDVTVPRYRATSRR